MIVQLDYNENKNECHIALSDADVRERLYYAFSAPNEAKKFVLSSRRRFIPDRTYFIKPTRSI